MASLNKKPILLVANTLGMALLIFVLGSTITCKPKAKSSRGVYSQSKGEIVKIRPTWDEYNCQNKKCNESPAAKYPLTATLQEKSNDLHLAPIFPIIEEKLVIDIAKLDLEIAVLHANLKIEAYDRKEFEVQSCYHYIFDEFLEIFILSKVYQPMQIKQRSNYDYLIASAGQVCFAEKNKIRSINNNSSISPKKAREWFFSYLDSGDATLHLFSKILDFEVVAKNLDGHPTRSFKQADLRNLEDPFVAKKTQKVIKKVDHIMNSNNPTHDAAKRILKGDFNENDFPALVSSLPDSDLRTLFRFSTIKNINGISQTLGEEVVRRIGQLDTMTINPKGALKEKGIIELIALYKKKYKGIENLDIEPIQITGLQFSWAKFLDEIPENGKKAFLVADKASDHRGLVYVDKEAKIIFYSDSIGLNSIGSHRAYLSLERDGIPKGFEVASFNSPRQSDPFSCAIYCLKDAEIVHTKGVHKTAQETRSLVNDKLPPVPAELLVFSQSLKKLEVNQRIGEIIRNGRNNGKRFEEIEIEINSYLDDLMANKTNGQNQHIQLAKDYKKIARDIFEHPELDSLYFYRSNALGDIETPLEAAKRFEANDDLIWISEVRSLFLSKIFQKLSKRSQ